MPIDKTFEKAFLAEDSTVLDAIKVIDVAGLQIALVIDSQNVLLGTITDGDVRRGILNGVQMDDNVEKIMNTTPFKVEHSTSRQAMLDLMAEHKILQLPIVDKEGRVTDIMRLDTLAEKARIPKENFEDVTVVLMAGGLGSRLMPLTKECPKPMIEVGGKPLLQTIIERFAGQGFKNFYISVNYKSNLIKDHFKDGTALGVKLQYLDEDQRMGTAGALSLIPEKPPGPLVVMNGDILTNSNFSQMVSFHRQNNALATMCVREYQQQVPYGVVQTSGTKLQSIVEKPSQSYFVNAGIYVIEPEALSYIPDNQFFDMPEMFTKIEADGKESAVYPIREYWLDIGNVQDLERGREEYNSIFNSKNSQAAS